jgi:hypothetical protein
VEVLGIEHEKARSGDGGHGRGPARAAQRRHLSKKMPSTEPNALVLELDLHFSGRDEIHGMRGLAAPGDDVAGLDLLRVQQPHDIGDIGCLKFCEQGHAGDHAPGDNKIATVDLVRERGRDDADRQGDHDQSNEDRNGRNDPQRRHGNDVTIADRAQRDDRPPHRVGNGTEFVGLRMLLDHMHDARGQKRRTQQNHEAAEQSAALVVKTSNSERIAGE